MVAVLMYTSFCLLHLFNEKIETSIDQTAVPHNNIYLKKKELSRYLIHVTVGNT